MGREKICCCSILCTLVAVAETQIPSRTSCIRGFPAPYDITKHVCRFDIDFGGLARPRHG